MAARMFLKTKSSTKTRTVRASLLEVPPSFFSISMGLTGLAGVWRLAGSLYGWPEVVSEFLYGVATSVYLVLVVALFARLVLKPSGVLAGLRHPVLGPFYALFPINGMLLSSGLRPYLPDFARGLFEIFFVATLLLGAWLTGQWMEHKLPIEQFHPGYFLPTVAGGFVGADGAARFGLEGLGWLSFGIGLICWLALNPIILNRLFFYPSLPPNLVPLLVIELAPPVVGGSAYYALSGGKLDFVAYILAGYSLLMVLVQLRLVLVYLKVPFGAVWWAFTFTYTSTAIYSLRWLSLIQPDWATLAGYFLVGAISLFVGGIALRSLPLLWGSLFKTIPQPTQASDGTSENGHK